MDAAFRLGDWLIRPELDRITGPAGDVHLQPKAMRVLACLAHGAPNVVTKEQLFQEVWEGTFVTDEALTFVIWELRKALGDDARRPRFIETIPKRGYRLIASPRSDAGATERDVRPPDRRRHAVGLLAGVVGLVLGVGPLVWFRAREPRPPALSFSERDWVLVTPFENRTGEAIFDDSLGQALERELTRSAFVNVAPRERIDDTLRLMRRPRETRLDLASGREIALRDGAIRAILAGQIDRGASGYLVSLRVVDPTSGATVSNPSARVGSRDEVLLLLPRLSEQLRRVLGEELPAGPGRPLPLQRMTTRSLRALELFSQALAFAEEDNWPNATELLRRAVDEDPDFASAHIWLAHAYSNLGRQEAGPHYERALALSGGVPDRERYFILGSYYARFLRDEEKAIQAFEILTRLHPDDYWAVHKLASLHGRRGHHRAATAYRLRAAQLRPDSFLANLSACLHLLRNGRDRVTETPSCQRARALVTPEREAEMPEEVAELELIPAADHWLHGDLPRTLDDIERVGRSLSSAGGPAQRYRIEFVGRAYLTLGMARAAESRFRALPDPGRRSYFLAQIALARGDKSSFARHLGDVDIATHLRSHWLDATALVASGDTGILSRAHAYRIAGAIRAMQADSLPDPLAGFVRDFASANQGELLLARGRVEESIPLLERAVERFRERPRPVFFLAAESLANAWELRGQREKALQVLREAACCRSGAFDDGIFRMRVQLRVAELSRSLGRADEARAVEAELRRLLAYADPDHAILQGLARLSQPWVIPNENPTGL